GFKVHDDPIGPDKIQDAPQSWQSRINLRFSSHLNSFGPFIWRDWRLPGVGLDDGPRHFLLVLLFSLPINHSLRLILPRFNQEIVELFQTQRLFPPPGSVPLLKHPMNRLSDMESRRRRF